MNKLNRILPAELNHDTVTAVSYGGEVWYVRDEVCSALGIPDPSEAVESLDWDDWACIALPARYPGIPVFIVNESGLYALALQGRTPGAAEFRTWMTSEILPSICGIESHAPRSRRPDLRNPSDLLQVIEDFYASEREHNLD